MSAAAYTVRYADYLDNEEGIVEGAHVHAVEGEAEALLYVTRIGEEDLAEPVAVARTQLQEVP